MKPTNFDRYLKTQLADPAFAERFAAAGEAWDVSLRISALREQAGLSQKQLADALRTSQQQISRLESPGYEGHSLAMLRRVAAALGARVTVRFDRIDETAGVAESPGAYRAVVPSKKAAAKRGGK